MYTTLENIKHKLNMEYMLLAQSEKNGYNWLPILRPKSCGCFIRDIIYVFIYYLSFLKKYC